MPAFIRSLRSIMGVPLLLLSVQLLIVLGVQSGGSAGERYRRLFHWDSGHFAEIARNGYRSAVPPVIDTAMFERIDDILEGTNVAFFPGYPLAARFVHALTGLPWEWVLPLTAQFFAIVFFAYVLSLLRLLAFPARTRIVILLLLLSFPSAFFLVAGYSESLALASALGFLYWSLKPGRVSPVAAAAHGFVMTGTRLSLLPVILFPVCLLIARWIEGRQMSRREIMTGIAVSALGAAGAASVFVFSEIAFGHWNLYMLRQQWGWGVAFDPLFFVSYPLLTFAAATPENGLDPYRMSSVLSAVFPWMFLVYAAWEWRARRTDDRSVRIALGVIAFLLWFLAAGALASNGMQSMVRYVFLPYMLLIFAFFHLQRDSRNGAGMPRRTLLLVSPWILLCSAVQVLAVRLFTGNFFVA